MKPVEADCVWNKERPTQVNALVISGVIMVLAKYTNVAVKWKRGSVYLPTLWLAEGFYSGKSSPLQNNQKKKKVTMAMLTVNIFFFLYIFMGYSVPTQGVRIKSG